MLDVKDSDKIDGAVQENISSRRQAKEHKKQLQRLEEKDPEFYQFLKEHDKDLLEFNDEDIGEDAETDLDEIEPQTEDIDVDAEADVEDVQPQVTKKNVQKQSRKLITTAMVDSWCMDIKENKKLGAIRSLLRAFRTACHYGDDGMNESSPNFSIVSSSVFNKIMLFVLNEMDGILRELLKAPRSGGKKETIMGLMTTRAWKNYDNLMRLYLGNALHVLNQMTDEQMAAFTLRRVKASSVFLAAFPTLLRKYIKVALHFWESGEGALQVTSFLFLRDLCIRLGSDCLDTCLKGIYKGYVSICKIKGKYASASKLQHIHFLGNCVAELYGVDLPSAYQHAFIFIRQLAMILRSALTEKTKEAYLKVYDWKFINCLELWATVICAYNSEADFRPLAYPLSQIIFGVARLVPTARYLPIRLRCARLLNRIAASMGTFIPVSQLLLDMLDMKELSIPPTGGVGKTVDLFTRKLVGKPTLKTRAFQEACILSVVEQLAEHLAQWSYSIAFFELSFVPIVRLRSFCKSTKVDRFRKEIKELIRQVEANIEFTNARRGSIGISPNDPATTSFLKVEKESGASPLSQFIANLHLRAQQRNDSMVKSSVLVGEKASVFRSKPSEDAEEEDDRDTDEGAAVFSSSWLPDSKAGLAKSKRSKQKKIDVAKSKRSKQQPNDQEHEIGQDEDVVEDLVLSSDDDEAPVSDSEEEKHGSKDTPSKQGSKKRKPSSTSWKRKGQPRGKKLKTKKGAIPHG